MESKRKMIISITIFAVAILAVVITIVSVLAAQNVTVNSSINITYTSDKIIADVAGYYTVAGGTEQSIGSISFDGSEDNDDVKLLNSSAKNITGIDKDHTYVEFRFTFTNGEDADYIASLVFTDAENETSITVYSKVAGGSYSAVSGSAGVYTFADLTVQANTTSSSPKEFFVKIEIDPSEDIDVAGTFAWNLELA